jgi:hypothetical protein
VFTARYALSPYMKQVRFVFKRLIITLLYIVALTVFIFINDVYRCLVQWLSIMHDNFWNLRAFQMLFIDPLALLPVL